jgi:hypothetical protein
MDIHYEGTLLVPPDRGTIIGRAIWKVSCPILPLLGVELTMSVQPRFVVLGRQNRLEPVLPRSASSNKSTSGRKSAKSPSSKPSKDNLDSAAKDKLWLSIYKQKVCHYHF